MRSRSQSRSPNGEHEKYRLKVTAGPDYDTKTHQVVPVNKDQTLHFENEHAIVSVCVRIQDYTGMLRRIYSPKDDSVELRLILISYLQDTPMAPRRAAHTSPTPSTRTISIPLRCNWSRKPQ